MRAIINYYTNGRQVSSFAGDVETIESVFFHLDVTSLMDLSTTYITYRTAENREYVLDIIPGGFSWKECMLNRPDKLIEQ